MTVKRKRTTATVCIVESLELLQEDTLREGEIIARTLRLSGKQTHYTYLRSNRELEIFVDEFGKSEHRYLHISCHGNKGAFYTTTGEIPAAKFAKMLAPHVRGRRVFLSVCLAAKSVFATRLLENSECLSVVAPVGRIDFDDAAIFWTAFYHLMFKKSPGSMNLAAMERTVQQCAELVGERFRLFHRDKDGEVCSKTLG